MGKVNEIIEGWKNVVFPNEEVERIAKNRAAICFICPNNVNGKCNKCGCNLSAKIRSPKSKCPDNKW